jgi:hypothetical protein
MLFLPPAAEYSSEHEGHRGAGGNEPNPKIT